MNSNFYLYDLINHLLFLLSIVLIFFFYIEGNNLLLNISIIMGILILVRFMMIKFNNSYTIFFIISLLIVFSLLKMMFYSEVFIDIIFSVIMLFSQLGLAFYLIKGKYSDVSLVITFYISSGYFLMQFWEGLPPSQVIFVSENIVNFIMLSLAIGIYLSRYIKGKTVILHPAIINLLVALWSTGRTGIIAAIILLILILFYRYNFKQIYLVIVATGFIIIFYNQYMIETIRGFGVDIATRGGTRGGIAGDVRFDIWKTYLNELDTSFFIFGFNSNIDYVFFGFNNLHNSFLDGHMQFGIFMLLIYALLVIACIKLIRIKHLFLVYLLLIFLLRSTTDIVVFTGRFDFIFLAIILFALFSKKNEKTLIKV